jgi:hypothetical protein
MDNSVRDDRDRGLVEAMQELRALAQVQVPVSSQARVDREVEAAINRLARERTEQTMNQAALATPAVGRVRPTAPAASGRARRRSPVLTWLATAALLVVTLGASIAAVGSLQPRSAQPILLPAFLQGETPEGISDTQFTVTFPTPILPAGPVYAWSTLYSVDPEVSAAYPGFKIESPVAALVWVQSGTMAIDGVPIAVHRAAAGAPPASPAAGELMLSAGDAVGVELGPGRSYQLRNVGSEPLVFAEFWIVGGPAPLYTWPPAYQILDYNYLANAAVLTSPATVTMGLIQTVLPPEETLTPAAGDWHLALTDRGSGSAISRQLSSNALTNMTQAPVTVVAMTVEFQVATATPTS